MSWTMFELFENDNYICEENIKLVTGFICANLINWSPNRSYYQCQYNYVTKLYHACKWRKDRGFCAIAKKVEAIFGDELVKLFGDKADKTCICSLIWIIFYLIFYELYDNFIRGIIAWSFCKNYIS